MKKILNNKYRFSLLLYIIGISTYIGIFLFKYDNNILLYTSIFLVFIIINRLGFYTYANKKLIKNYLYFTEFCFLLYVIFVFIFGPEYFLRYKILVIPCLVLMHVQLFILPEHKAN